MNKLHRYFFPLSVCAFAISTAFAQTAEEDLALVYGDKDTVSIATGSKQLLRRAPSVATVITAEDIKTMGATTLDEVMETVPGVHVTRNFLSNFPIYLIRGVGSGSTTNPQVLMLQNGIPYSSIYRGDRGQGSGSPTLENVERIEIIRGPGSALYGADAFAGVINIITKNADTAPGTTVGARVGSFNSQNAWVQHGSQHGAFNVAAYLQAGRADSSNQIVTSDAATRLNAIFHNQTSDAPGPMNTGDKFIEGQLDLSYDKWRLRSGYRWNSQGVGLGASSALDPIGREKAQRVNADLSWNDAQLTRNWGLGFTGSYLQYDEDMSYQMFPKGTILPAYTVSATTPANVLALLNNPAIGTVVPNTFTNGMQGMPSRRERQFRFSGNATYSGFTDHNIRLGAGHEDLNLYDITSIKNFWLNPAGVPVPTGPLIDYAAIQPHQLPHRRFNDYAYLQDEWNFTRDWTLTWGVRHDNFSDFGSTDNPRLALVWDATYDLTAKLMYGQAFRAPSANEQYGINPAADGNSSLKPERIKTMEAAVSWQARKDTKLNLNLFHYVIRDAIVPTPKRGGVGSQYTNTGQLHDSGMEVETVWDATRNLRLTANFSWQALIDESTNTDAGYAPRKHAYARADWRMAENWMLSPQIDWVADRRRVQKDTRPQIPDYTTFDLTLHNTSYNSKWDFSVSAHNLFNATALEPTLYLAAPQPLPAYPTSAIPFDQPVLPRTIWLQATYQP